MSDKTGVVKLNADGVHALEDLRNVLASENVLVPSLTPSGVMKLENPLWASNLALVTFALQFTASSGPREAVMNDIANTAMRRARGQ